MNKISLLLKNEFEKRRKRNNQFSIRAYARWLGLSPAQVSQMINGKRNITIKCFQKISEKLNLTPFEQKKYLQEYNTYYKNPNTQINRNLLNEDQFKLISDWYHLSILSLTKIKNIKNDSRWIAQQLGITSLQVNEAISRLKRLGCLQVKPELKQIGEPFQVSSKVPAAAIRKYHIQNLALASEKIETIDLNEREYQSMSFPLSPKKVQKIKLLIDTFLDDVLEIAQDENDINQEVYHINVQLFPVTQISKTKGISK